MDTREKEIEKLKDYKYGFSTDIESTTALSIFASLISMGSLLKTYPPLAPLMLLTMLCFFNFENICSRKSKDMPCLKDISLKDTGLLLLNFAKSAKAITAYLPFDVNFIFTHI